MTSFVDEGILPREVGLTEALFGMNLTPYHFKLFAHELTKRCPSIASRNSQPLLLMLKSISIHTRSKPLSLPFGRRSQKVLCSPMRLGSARRSKPVSCFHRNGPNANGGYSSLLHQTSASSGIRSYKKSFSCHAAFLNRSPTMTPYGKVMSARLSVTISSSVPTSSLDQKRHETNVMRF